MLLSSDTTAATLVLVGPPNVGKSTIFNVLTKSRAALVADFSGVTRDPLVGQMQLDGIELTLVDTGGFSKSGERSINALVNDRIQAMISEADMVLMVVEKAAQPDGDIQLLVRTVRRANKPLLLLLNKADRSYHSDTTDWYRMHPNLIELAAVHRRGIGDLITRISEQINADKNNKLLKQQAKLLADDTAKEPVPRLVITGRPNVGKSTLVNYLIGSNRMITSDQAGTTRDVLAFDLRFKQAPYVLLDTPGVRRWGRIHQALEKFSVLKGVEALRHCDTGILLIDGVEGLLEQDLKLLHRFSEISPATIIAVNKTDALDAQTKSDLTRQLSRRAPQLAHYPLVFVSAQRGGGVAPLVKKALELADTTRRDFATSLLMRTMEKAIDKLQPPTSGRFRPRLKFIHQVTPRRRITFRISGNQVTKLHPSYVTYIRNTLISTFDLQGINIDIHQVDSENPYLNKT